MSAVYIHVPFCVRKCGYCDFHSVPFSPDRYRTYVHALHLEIRSRAEELKGPLTSVYFGGGTPSLCDAMFFEDTLALLDGTFGLDNACEITVEFNPSSVIRERAETLRRCGVNRASLGIQSFSDRTLQTLGRIHSAKQAVNSWDVLTESGYTDISIDLMFAVPGQNIDEFEQDLAWTISRGPQHCSVYGLSVEPGTPFHKQGVGIDEDIYRAMFLAAHEALTTHGYEHYEISNYARPGFYSRHNRHYWHRRPYLGLGPGAHSFRNGVRCANSTDHAAWAGACAQRHFVPDTSETLSAQQERLEAIMLALRQAEGLNFKQLRDAFGFDLETRKAAELALLAQNRIITQGNGVLRLTVQGMLLADTVIERLSVES